MRIAGGRFKNHPLSALGNTREIRPTSDKVRQAVFNMLEARGLVEDAHVLDAFCGTGALGLEALSRGAKCCTFWDIAQASLKIAKENAALLGADDIAVFVRKDAAKCQKAEEGQAAFDLVFLDPPYNQGLVSLAMTALSDGSWIAPEAVFVIELAKGETPDLSALDILQEKLYGDTRILIAAGRKE